MGKGWKNIHEEEKGKGKRCTNGKEEIMAENQVEKSIYLITLTEGK